MQDLDKVNDVSLLGNVSNSGVMRKIGGEFKAAGVRNIADPNSDSIDADTMMGEGSVGKVRFAGLAFMLEQDGVIDLQQNAKEFFSSRKIIEFLEKKYPDKKIQEEILKLFSGDSEKATLADLTTHSSGVGDLTRDQGRHFNKMGVNADYTLPTLLSQPLDNEGVPLKENIPRDAQGKPRAQSAPNVKDQDLPRAEYGAHQYSNLGYVLLGVAMEGSYEIRKGKNKTYKDLMHDYMLHPIEGRAAGGELRFNSTKFPKDIKSDDNITVANWRDKATNQDINANQFNGANAAGGMFSSANDAEKYFKEYFKGFPGTPEFERGEKNKNHFFSDDTINRMVKEQNKFEYTERDIDRAGNYRCWGPGFTVSINSQTKEVVQYDKGGGCFGYASKMVFYPQTATVDFRVVVQENITGAIAKEAGVGLEKKEESKTVSLMGAYRTQDDSFDRRSVLKDNKE